jgi:hypothetical protein
MGIAFIKFRIKWIKKGIVLSQNSGVFVHLGRLKASLIFILLSLGLSRQYCYRPIALTSQILRVSSRCSLTISVQVQQPHTAQKLTILIQNYYKVLQNLLCLQKLYYA